MRSTDPRPRIPEGCSSQESPLPTVARTAAHAAAGGSLLSTQSLQPLVWKKSPFPTETIAAHVVLLFDLMFAPLVSPRTA
jgi:hypothetical protein